MGALAALTRVAVLVGVSATGAAGPASAADLGASREAVAALPTEGVACDDGSVEKFPAVWQGHFTGGYSHYLGEGGPIVQDWRDEKLCFPNHRSCTRYIAEMRRDYHRPEGYFTCLPIR